MILEVDGDSPVPSYEQLREQLVTLITSGVLAQGTRLPTIRQLAADLDLAPGTIQRAYREVEADGMLVARGRKGTTVAPSSSWQTDATGQLEQAAADYLRRAAQLGLDAAAALAAVRSVARSGS